MIDPIQSEDYRYPTIQERADLDSRDLFFHHVVSLLLEILRYSFVREEVPRHEVIESLRVSRWNDTLYRHSVEP